MVVTTKANLYNEKKSTKYVHALNTKFQDELLCSIKNTNIDIDTDLEFFNIIDYISNYNDSLNLFYDNTENTDNTCIVVMDLDLDQNNEFIQVGALVDSVEAVHEIDEKTIEPPPSIGKNYKSEFITGVAKTNNGFIMILDLIKLFTCEELSDLKIIK